MDPAESSPRFDAPETARSDQTIPDESSDSLREAESSQTPLPLPSTGHAARPRGGPLHRDNPAAGRCSLPILPALVNPDAAGPATRSRDSPPILFPGFPCPSLPALRC